MTQVDFYISQQEQLITRLHLACRLTEKALSRNHQVLIALDDQAQASSLSEYLWSFKPESFLPHQLQSQGEPAPIALVWDQDIEQHHDILINLKHAIPGEFSRFQRVIEIVVQDSECLQATRDHFQFYRDRGYPLKSHTV